MRSNDQMLLGICYDETIHLQVWIDWRAQKQLSTMEIPAAVHSFQSHIAISMWRPYAMILKPTDHKWIDNRFIAYAKENQLWTPQNIVGMAIPSHRGNAIKNSESVKKSCIFRRLLCILISCWYCWWCLWPVYGVEAFDGFLAVCISIWNQLRINSLSVCPPV